MTSLVNPYLQETNVFFFKIQFEKRKTGGHLTRGIPFGEHYVFPHQNVLTMEELLIFLLKVMPSVIL